MQCVQKDSNHDAELFYIFAHIVANLRTYDYIVLFVEKLLKKISFFLEHSVLKGES